MTFAGQDWREEPELAEQMFAVFLIMRQLHELLWYVTEALTFEPARSLHDELRRALDETEGLTRKSPDFILDLDVEAHRRQVSALLRRASELARAEARQETRDYSGADLVGASFQGGDLRGASLRGALLIGANLQGADLRVADLIGADLRGADLSHADLTGAIFLTQSQIDAARGDADTKLPLALIRPRHWLGASDAR